MIYNKLAGYYSERGFILNIYEIAKLADASISSVSRVLNNQPGVRAEMRAKIEQIIAEQDYRPNLLARELTKKKTNVIGIILSGINSYYTASIEAVSHVCQANNYSIMIATNSTEQNCIDRELENFRLLAKKQVDGIVFFASLVDGKHIELLKKITTKIPIVSIGYECSELSMPCVLQDDYGGARKAMEYLIANGHRRIGFISGPEYNFGARKRYCAYQDVLQENGYAVDKRYVRQGTFSKKSGYSAMKSILECEERPTAVFTANDDMAIGAMRLIYDIGMRIPEDISIIGFDDVDVAAYLNPELTTVRQEQYDTGFQAAQMLIQSIEEQTVKIKKVIMDQTLIIRSSTRKI